MEKPSFNFTADAEKNQVTISMPYSNFEELCLLANESYYFNSERSYHTRALQAWYYFTELRNINNTIKPLMLPEKK